MKNIVDRFLKSLLFVSLIFLMSCNKNQLNTGIPEVMDHNDPYKFTEEEVITNVKTFLSEFYRDNIETKSENDLSIKEIIPISDDNLPITKGTDINVNGLLYAVNLNEGFILAAADKRTIPVLAYIEDTDFSNETLVSSIENEGFLQYLERTIININEDIKDNEVYRPAETKAYPIKERIMPLLGKTKWNQSGNPYALYCPTGTPAGCVITALAQISSYYKSPSSVYYGDNIPQNPMGGGFTLNLNWDEILAVSDNNSGRMPMSDFEVTDNEYDESQAVALYMRYIGCIVDASYTADGTGASMERAISYMKNNIGLQSTDPTKFDRVDIYNHIRGGNLLLMTGYATRKGFIFYSYSDGHAWVADGVFVSDHDHQYFHYNWGWGGNYNGYFFEDRWNPGRSEFDDNGNEVPQGDYGKDFKYKLRCAFVSW